MKVSNERWKAHLGDRIPAELGEEIDIFETEIERRRHGLVDEKIFAETRLRRGAYGQRYDNGLRHDGEKSQTLPYEDRPTKGPNTAWDAPGMQRIKIPFGGLSPQQLETLAELGEEYSDGIVHITTRQDFQLHYVNIDDTPSLMRRLGAAGITTREACGNSVRNVTGCPFAGVCPDEIFDVTPYARSLSRFLLGHPDCQSFGRKFKPTFSGCAQHACGLTAMHDLGLTAEIREIDGKPVRGFRMVVGGGLGPVPHQAKLFDEFLPPEELLPVAQAIARVFARLGEKKNRNRARIKFLIRDLGVEKFREIVLEERAGLPHDERWTAYLDEIDRDTEEPLRPPGEMPRPNGDQHFELWLNTNVRPQRQEGYSTVTVSLPLGDITGNGLRALADIVREYTRGTVRTSVEQNFVIRWVSNSDLQAIYDKLKRHQLADAGAGNIFDMVACPGTDTCKLGISSSRGLAAELKKRLDEKSYQLDEAVRKLHIKISGCFNSCGQHHIADMGFYGVSRRVNGYKVPHFQVILGGQWEENAASYGLPIIAIPSKRIPEAVDRLTDRFLRDRQSDETFRAFMARIGKAEVMKLLEDLRQLPTHDEDPSYYVDWSDAREYTTGDIGVGECAGEVVTSIDFELTAAERLVFEGQVLLDSDDAERAGGNAYRAMLMAAKALVKLEFYDVSDDEDTIVGEFRRRFFDTQKIFDPFAGGKFANYLFAAHERRGTGFTAESAHHTIEEAQLFIEAVHACYDRLGSGAAS